MRILNRILRLGENGLPIEADPPNAAMLLKALDIADSKGAATPGVKEEADYEMDLCDDMVLIEPKTRHSACQCNDFQF